jgi:hypothetical protein
MFQGYTWCNRRVATYREKLSPSVWLMVAIGLVIPATALIFLPVNLPLGIAVGAGLWAGSVGLLWWAAPALRVENGMFHAGRASIELSFVGQALAFTKEEARAQRGVELDARAWLALRPWVDAVVRVELTDPSDPTPYWLVSSKKPDALIAALQAAQPFSANTPGKQSPI